MDPKGATTICEVPAYYNLLTALSWCCFRKEKLQRTTFNKEKSRFGSEYRKIPLPADKKAQSERSHRVPEGEKKSQRDWSISLEQARAPSGGGVYYL